MGEQHHIDTAGERSRLLIIEPNRSYLGTIGRRLAEFGFRVATAQSAQDGLAELHRVPVDLILSELKLPGTSGVELVRMIRQDAVHRHLPVLLMAGRSDNRAIEAFKAGADGVVRKPFDFDFLAARINREIERARSVESLRQDNAVLDARVISRAIELGEMRQRWEASEAERLRLQGIAGS